MLHYQKIRRSVIVMETKEKVSFIQTRTGDQRSELENQEVQIEEIAM